MKTFIKLIGIPVAKLSLLVLYSGLISVIARAAWESFIPTVFKKLVEQECILVQIPYLTVFKTVFFTFICGYYFLQFCTYVKDLSKISKEM